MRKIHKAGKSLREIAEETSLGLRTVRTIIAKGNGTDRTTIKQLERIAPDRARERAWQAKAQQRKHLPRKINELRKAGDAPLKEAKGLVR